MAYELKGKAVQRVELAVTNCGYNSPIKVIMAKQNDKNSRFIHAIIHDSDGIIDCSACTIRLNARLPDGTYMVCYGEIVNEHPYVLIASDLLSQVGRVACDITLIGTCGDVKAGVGSSVGVTDVKVDAEKFKAQTTEGGRYVFTFNDSEWKLDGLVTTLSKYGIEAVGIPVEGDSILVDYSPVYTLTTETFYLMVDKTNYMDNADEGTTSTSFIDYIKGRFEDVQGDIVVLKETTGTDLYLDVTSNKIYLTNRNNQIIGNGIEIPATVNGFITESDENGNTYLYLAHDGEIIGDGIVLPQGAGSGGKYTNNTPTPASLGGIEKGETFDNVPFADMFTKLLYPYVAFTINSATSVPNGGVFEKGETKTVTSFNVRLTKGSANITKIEVSLSGNAVASSESEDFGTGVVTLTPQSPISITSNASFSAKVTDATNKSFSSSTGAFSFVYPYYYGVADADATVDETFIKTLTKLVQGKGSKTVSYTASNQKMVFVSPYVVSKITDPNGFNVTDTFTMTRISVTGLDGTAQSYYVYTANEASTVTNFRMTFTN